MRVEITEIHSHDDYYEYSNTLVGLIGEFIPIIEEEFEGFYPGKFHPDEEIILDRPYTYLYFYGIKFNDLERDKEKGVARVLCIDNKGIEDLVTKGRMYSVDVESKTLYHIRCNKKYIFYFPKDKFRKV